MISAKIIVGGTKEKRQKKSQQIIEEEWGESLSFSHPDFLLVEGLNSISINQIRDLQRKLSLKPYSAPSKIALIQEAEKLTLAAQNALLKTLEEPPSRSIIILTTPQTNFLLPTIVSRCQVIKLKAENELEYETKYTSNIKPSRVGECLKIASLYSNKNQAKEFCQQLLIKEREEMLNQSSYKKARNIHLILKTISMLEKNVNPQLATGNLLINLIK